MRTPVTTQSEFIQFASPYERNNFVSNSNNPAVRDIAEVLPDFDPTAETSVSVEHFVNRINNLIEVYRWDERLLLLAVYTKLKGPSKLWLDGSSEVYKTWQEFSSKLVETFKIIVNEADIHLKLMQCSRNPGERIVDYCYRVSALGRRYNLSEAAIIKYARSGLKHSSLQLAIASVNFNDLRQMIQTIESYMSNRPSVSSTTPRGETIIKNAMSKTPSYMNKVTQPTKPSFYRRTNNVKDITCYNCFENGHMSIKCPKPQRRLHCDKCYRTGHTAEKCFENSPNIRKIKTELQPNTMIKTVKVNNLIMEAFIDTGSDRSIIKNSVAIKVGSTREIAPVILKGFAGGEFVCKSSIHVTIELDQIKMDAVLLVVDDQIL